MIIIYQNNAWELNKDWSLFKIFIIFVVVCVNLWLRCAFTIKQKWIKFPIFYELNFFQMIVKFSVKLNKFTYVQKILKQKKFVNYLRNFEKLSHLWSFSKQSSSPVFEKVFVKTRVPQTWETLRNFF